MSWRHAIRRVLPILGVLVILAGITSLPAAAVGSSLAHAQTSVAQSAPTRSATVVTAATPKLSADLYYATGATVSTGGTGLNDTYLIQRQPNGTTSTIASLGLYGLYYGNSLAVSPNGRQVAFSTGDCSIPGALKSCGDYVVAIMNIDGSNEHVIPNGDSPRWSPDGQWVYFESDSSPSGIYKAHPDGSGLTRIFSNGGTNWSVGDIALSPDGTKIAYYRWSEKPDGSHQTDQLYVSNVNGSHAVRVPNQPSGVDVFNTQPAWTPNGKTLVFRSYQGFALLERINVDGSDLVQLTHWEGSSCNDLQWPTVSPDDSTVVFDYEFCGLSKGSLRSVPMSGSQVETNISRDTGHLYAWPTYGPVHVQPTKTIVALGDSVAAGEGTDYDFTWSSKVKHWVSNGRQNQIWRNTAMAYGQDYQDCHQSGHAYPDLLSGSTYTVYNMACTGAGGINGVLNSFGNAPAQLGGICHGCAAPNTRYDSFNPDVVTLSLGADDIDFKHWVQTCYSPGKACNTATNTNAVNLDLDDAKANLRLVLDELNRRAGLDGKKVLVVATNYYDPYQSKYVKCLDTSGVSVLKVGIIGITPGEQSWIVSGLDKLNANIAAEVAYAQAHDPHLTVRLADISKVMATGPGHQFCTANPWVYGPSIDYSAWKHPTGSGNPSPMHPTPAGQAAIEGVVAATIAR